MKWESKEKVIWLNSLGKKYFSMNKNKFSLGISRKTPLSWLKLLKFDFQGVGTAAQEDFPEAAHKAVGKFISINTCLTIVGVHGEKSERHLNRSRHKD